MYRNPGVKCKTMWVVCVLHRYLQLIYEFIAFIIFYLFLVDNTRN